MVNICFENSAKHASVNPVEGFAGFERRCRQEAADALKGAYGRAVQEFSNARVSPEAVRRGAILKNAFQAAAGGGSSSFEAEFEATLSLSREHAKEAFHEALIRLHDGKGETVYPDRLFAATDGFDGTDEAGRKLRLWVFAKQMKEFYEKNDFSAPLSLNINPIDMRHADFRAGIEDALSLAREIGCKEIILEALEQAPWEESESRALTALRDRFGVKIAIDDYGSGCHNSGTLERLKPDFVKLDGHLVRDFIENRNDNLVARLNEIKEKSPCAAVVAEWVSTPEEINEIMERLDRRDLPKTIHLVQGRDLARETPRHFLSRLDALKQAIPFCPVRMQPSMA